MCPAPGKSAITIVTGRTGIMHDICKTLTPPGSGAAVGISVAFRDERAAGDGLRRGSNIILLKIKSVSISFWYEVFE